jgi:ribonuclease HI
MNGENRRITKLRVRQQNTNKSLTATSEMLAKCSPDQYDILAIQEPHIDFLGNARATPSWYTVYPDAHFREKEKRTRSMILINKKIHTSTWRAVEMGTPDITAITIRTNTGDVLIINTYVDCTHSDSIRAIQSYLQKQAAVDKTQERSMEGIIWLGDFNRHHPMWDEMRNSHLFTRANLDDAQELLDAVAEHDLHMVLPKELPTLKAMATGNHTRTDNVFISPELAESLISCNTVPEDQPPRTDHFPIDTVIELSVKTSTQTPRPNYRQVEWKEYNKTLKKKLEETIDTPALATPQQFHHKLHALTKSIADTTEALIPKSKPSPYMKRWWSLQLTQTRTETRRLGRKAYARRNNLSDPAHEDYRTARNRYAEAIEKAKKDHWKDFLDRIDQKTIWTASKYASADTSDGGRTRIPTLVTTQANGTQLVAETNREKEDLLFDTFFPEPNTNIESVPPDYEYPPPAFEYEPITDAQIRRAIDKLNPFKAPGENGIPNVLIKQCVDVLLPYLGPLFRATFELKTYPAEWRDSITKVLRKPGKADYTAPGAYRPIALLDTIGKVLSACVAEDLVKMTEKHHLLPEHHFGCRPGRTTTDAIHYVVGEAKDAWRRGRVMGLLYLDIKGAFPSIILDRLTHNMRRRGVPAEYTDWIDRKVRDRFTTVSFDDHNPAARLIGRGMDQGCPLSAIAYQFYNGDLLDIVRGRKGEDSIGFVDDTTIMAEGADLEEAFGKLTDIMTRTDGAYSWAAKHDCHFAVEKFGLMGLTRRREKDPTKQGKTRPVVRPPIKIGQHVVKPTTTHKFLGMIIDQELRFKEHANYALKKGEAYISQYRRLTRPTKGVTAKHMRTYYLTVAVPRLLYAADVFLIPATGQRKGSKGSVNKLARIQRQAALDITGALRSTANDMLDAHANLLPFPLLVSKLVHRAAVRLACLPNNHPLAAKVRRSAKRYVKRHRSSIHEIMHAYSLNPERMEKIQTVVFGPKWQPAFRTRIPQSKEQAADEVKTEGAQVVIFSDGSCIDGGVGAAAILYKNGKEQKSVRLYLGPESEHTVFEAELAGAAIGAKMLNMESSGRYTIALDNQAAIQTTRRESTIPGQYLVNAIHRQVEGVVEQQPGARVVMRWVPGHEGIEGNERADEEAKKAAKGVTSHEWEIPIECRGTMPISRAAEIQRHNAELNRQARNIFAKSPRAPFAHEIDPTMPSAAFARITKDMPRRHASLLVQLRTGHIALNKYMHKIGKTNSPICAQCQNAQETVHHYLFRCPAYNEQRKRMEKALKRGANSIRTLLGGHKAMKHLFRYIHDTKRFVKSHGDVSLPEGKDRGNAR